MESVNQFAKIGILCSENTVIKKFSIITEVPTICCCLRRKNVKLHGIVGIPLGWREQDYWLPQANQPKWPPLKYLTKHMAYAFYKNHICVFLSVSKKKEKTNTLHLYSMRGCIKTLKHNVRTTLQLAYHGCKYLTHTSKTPHEKTHPNGCNC